MTPERAIRSRLVGERPVQAYSVVNLSVTVNGVHCSGDKSIYNAGLKVLCFLNDDHRNNQLR
jgi:hypothetical protein